MEKEVYAQDRQTDRQTDRQGNIEYITLLSVISAFAVVSLHTNGVFWRFSTERYWVTANIIESVYYFAVPIFFMISGITLLNYPDRYGTKVYFYKRLRKTLIPFLVWSLIGLAFRIGFVKDIHISDLSATYIFNGIVGTKFVDIYWFFIPLFMIYLAIPVLAHVGQKYKFNIFLYTAAAAFFINVCLPFIHNVCLPSISFPFSFDIAKGNLIYPLIGYVIANSNISRRMRYAIYGIAIIGLVMHILGTYILSIEAGKIIQTYKGYTNLPCIIYSTGIFLFFKENCTKIMNSIWVGKLIHSLKSYTFSIYMLHWFIMKIFVTMFHINTTSIIFRVLGPIPIIAICVFITYVIRKIPTGKYILP